jgi:hypothetical protein
MIGKLCPAHASLLPERPSTADVIHRPPSHPSSRRHFTAVAAQNTAVKCHLAEGGGREGVRARCAGRTRAGGSRRAWRWPPPTLR